MRISRQSAFSPLVLISPGTLVATGFLFLVFNDTSWAYVVPGSSLLRAVVPVLLVVCLMFDRQAVQSVESPGLSAALVFLALVSVVSAIVSDVPLLAFAKLVLFLGIVVPFCLSRSLTVDFGPTGKSSWRLTKVCVVILGLNLAFLGDHGAGMFNNPNQLGMFVVCAMPLFGGFAFSGGSRQSFARVGIVLGLALCIISGSRGALAGLLAGCAVFRALSRSPSWGSVLVTSVIFVGAFLAAMSVSDEIKAVAYKRGHAIVDETRALMLEESFEAFSKRPFFGYGFGLSHRVSANDIGALETGRLSRMVGEFGNSTLAVLVGGGMSLLVACAWLITVVLFRGLRAIAYETNDRRRTYHIAVLAGVAGLLVQSQAEGWFVSLTWPTLVFWLYVAVSHRISTQVLATSFQGRVLPPSSSASAGSMDESG